MFLLNSCLNLFSAACFQAPLLPKLRGHFAEFLDNASPAGLGLLALPTCVGLRYGYVQSYSGFSRQGLRMLRYFSSLLSAQNFLRGDLPPLPLSAFHRLFRCRLILSPCVPAVLSVRSTGISACCPSPTPFGLGLGPDFPRADQLYPGILRYSAWRILASISLLIPAFSLHDTPPLLPVWLLCVINAPLPIDMSRRTFLFHGFGGAFQPRVFSARDLSASELLRTL